MPKSNTKAKNQTKQTRLKYPATRQDDMRRYREDMKEYPIYVKNLVYRPPIRRRSTKNSLHPPSRSRKSLRKMNKPLGIAI